MTDRDANHDDLLQITSDIVSAHVSNNPVPLGELSGLIQTVYSTLTGLSAPAPEPEVELKPAVNPKKSVTDEYIVCLEDGKKLKMLKRHLSTAYDMTPEQYRAKWGLPRDYPMVAPNYAKKRQELARKIGLGRKPGIVEDEPTPQPKARRSRAKTAASGSVAAPRREAGTVNYFRAFLRFAGARFFDPGAARPLATAFC